MITNSKLQVLPATSDDANLFVSLQSNSSGFTNSILSATALTYNPFSKVLTLNGLRWPTVDGTSGQVLKTDGLGNLTFGSAGLVNFTDSLTTTSPNGSVPVVSLVATNSSYANIDAVFSPKGNGNILAQIPDGTAAGGNKRGTYSVDLQMQRSLASQVASGSNSVALGANNSATTIYSVAIGYGNTAQGSYSLAAVYQSSANNTGSVAIGYNCTAGGGNFSSVFGGDTNNASALAAAVVGGGGSTANAAFSIVVGGKYGITRGVEGYHVMPAHNAPITTSQGVLQAGLLLLGIETTGATPTALRSNTNAADTTNQLILPNNSAYYVKGTVIANVTGAGNTKSWSFEGVIKRGANAASTAIVGAFATNIIAADAGASTWTIALTADTTNGGLRVTVTGQTTTTIRWSCKLETNEVTF